MAVIGGLERLFGASPEDKSPFLRSLAVLSADFLTAGCDLLHSTAQFQSLHRAVR